MNAETDCVFRVLWVAHEDVGVIRSRACLEALETARTAACAKWPELARFYSRLEVIWPWSDAPPDALWEAAERSVRRLEAPPIELSLRCDVAVLGALSDIEIAGLLPAFVMPPKSGEAALFDAGGADALYDDGRRAAVAPTAVSVATLVDTLFAPPRGEGEMDRLLDYLAEDPSKAARLHSYALLLKASAASAREPPGRPDPWRSALDLLPDPELQTLAMASLRDAGARADALAIAYGEQWRSVLVARSLSFVFANAISGLVGALFPKLAIATIPIQFLATALIFVDRRMATRGRWRTKWLEYRTLAERLRVERFLALSGAAFPRAGASPWIEWLTRRLALPLPRAPDAAAVLRRLVDVEMADQIEYHQGAFQRFGALDRRIRGAATSSLVGLMTLGAAIAVLGFTPYAMAASSPWPAVGLALSVAPTIQATLNYVRRDLDVAGQLERSARISGELQRLVAAIALAPQDAATARAAARRAADIMTDDVKGWRAVYEVLQGN